MARFTIAVIQSAFVLALLGTGSSVNAGPPGDKLSEISLTDQLKALLAQKPDHLSDPQFLIRLADVCLDLGDEITGDMAKQKAVFEEGAKAARQAINLQDQNADAHYLYAANLGSATQLSGLMASALTVQDLKQHVDRALSLNPRHAPAMHMKGMMLEELPWFLGGDAEGALAYLQRSVAADPHDRHARLDLAKAYLKRKDTTAARKELETVLSQSNRSDLTASGRRHREEAQQLLSSLRSS
jgi:tetratricopeptide (TPR) repeat protein